MTSSAFSAVPAIVEAEPLPPGRPGPKPGIYHWRGQAYFGQRAVARAAGVAPSTVAQHLDQHGHLNLLGCGSGKTRRDATTAKPVALGDRAWRSIKHLAADMGVTPKAASIWLQTNQVDRILGRLMLADACGAKAGGA